MTRAYVGIGSNLGDALQNVRRAIDRLRTLGEVLAVSSLYRTAPWGKTDQPAFVNAAVALDTTRSARELLRALKTLEREFGREQLHEHWGPRVIDFDILTYGDETIDEDDLVIPHPRLRERAFVLVPLAEIAPQYAALRDALPEPELASVRPVEP